MHADSTRHTRRYLYRWQDVETLQVQSIRYRRYLNLLYTSLTRLILQRRVLTHREHTVRMYVVDIVPVKISSTTPYQGIDPKCVPGAEQKYSAVLARITGVSGRINSPVLIKVRRISRRISRRITIGIFTSYRPRLGGRVRGFNGNGRVYFENRAAYRRSVLYIHNSSWN